MRGLQQASRRQRGHGEEQPRQRHPGRRTEHRPGLLQQPRPSQLTFCRTRRRHGQHRQHHRRPWSRSGDGLRHRFRPSRPPGPAVLIGRQTLQPLTDRELRYPQPLPDPGQRFPGRTPRHHLRRHLIGDLAGPPRAGPGRHQPGHPAVGPRLTPPPHSDRANPEPGRHLNHRRRPTLDQLHRRQPPTRLVTVIPRIRQVPVQEDPTPVGVLHQHHSRADLHPHDRGDGQGRLSSHQRHHPTPNPQPNPFSNYIGFRVQKQPSHHPKPLAKHQSPNHTQPLCQEP